MTVSSDAAPGRTVFWLFADSLAVAVAAMLPWSTSAAAICIVLWLGALLPTLDLPALRRELHTAAGGLPVLLWALGAAGLLWTDVGWAERFAGFSSFHRLLVIPLLLAQFRRSGHGSWVAVAFLVSSALVLLASFVLLLTPGLTWRGNYDGVPVHDYLYQDSAFLICGFGAIGIACNQTVRRRPVVAIGLGLLGALFIANLAFATVSRAALFVTPFLVALLGLRFAGWKGLVCACAAAVALGTALWFMSPALRARVDSSVSEIRDYSATDDATSIKLHAAFLKESVKIILSAPILGHGTGSIHEQFEAVTAGAAGASGVVTVNSHNQTFAVGIQIGVIGAAVLWSMWIAHLLLFRGQGIAAWLGTVVVAENMASSTVHTHLFDFSNGWLYVFGVGVLGGSVLHARAQVAQQKTKIGSRYSLRD